MDEAEARAVAAREIAAMQAYYDAVDDDKREHGLPTDGIELVITKVARISDTWCAFYDDRRYIETGDVTCALAGNGPILIGMDGTVGRAGSALTPEHYVAEFEQRRSQ